jgi:hypothetical protein
MYREGGGGRRVFIMITTLLSAWSSLCLELMAWDEYTQNKNGKHKTLMLVAFYQWKIHSSHQRMHTWDT